MRANGPSIGWANLPLRHVSGCALSGAPVSDPARPKPFPLKTQHEQCLQRRCQAEVRPRRGPPLWEGRPARPSGTRHRDPRKTQPMNRWAKIYRPSGALETRPLFGLRPPFRASVGERKPGKGVNWFPRGGNWTTLDRRWPDGVAVAKRLECGAFTAAFARTKRPQPCGKPARAPKRC